MASLKTKLSAAMLGLMLLVHQPQPDGSVPGEKEGNSLVAVVDPGGSGHLPRRHGINGKPVTQGKSDPGQMRAGECHRA
jgi:hypothetical protein